MRIKKLQEGNIIVKQDNTRVSKPIIPEIIKAKPRQDQLIDLGGEPSTDTRTAAERNRDYWHPIKGAKERFKSSMRNGTNPLVGLERTVMPAMAGAALVTTPTTVVGGLVGEEAVNNAPVALLTMKKGGLIPRCQAGATIKDAAIGIIPIVGTYQDYKKFRDNPTWGNFGWLAASALGDALFFTGAGAALKGIKAARAAAKSRALLTANRYVRSQIGFQRGLKYGASRGDVKSMFQNLRNYKVAEQKQLTAEAAAR